MVLVYFYKFLLREILVGVSFGIVSIWRLFNLATSNFQGLLNYQRGQQFGACRELIAPPSSY